MPAFNQALFAGLPDGSSIRTGRFEGLCLVATVNFVLVLSNGSRDRRKLGHILRQPGHGVRERGGARGGHSLPGLFLRGVV